MTVANLITTIRIILAPIFIIYLINEQFSSALIVFVLCALSDGLDGMMARLFKQQSRLGTYLDPLADKILLIATFIALLARNHIPNWLTVVVIARDILILSGVIVLFLNRLEFNIRPSILGKLATCSQFATVISILSKEYLGLPVEFLVFIFYVTGLFTISSGLHYMHAWFKIINEGSGAQNNIS
ncbi:MAG: CDP-alcohol phosphatidyltransferase family protein [Deltaproteobacteria bacterium]|nr:CDP-alcohol phosphatidyltransferase family protein [Deltaproteobacteria bacterium]MBW2136861.1 CDP-alcohol phosphatidyltransferase family protein [Deltaproteobacteria bacterium]